MFKPIPSQNRSVKPFKTYRTVILTGSFDSASKVDDWYQEHTDAEVRNGAQYASLLAQFYGSQSYYMFGTDGEWTPGESVYIVNIPQHEFGEMVRPSSFTVSSPFPMIASNSLAIVGEISYADDGNSRIIEQITGNRVGDIIYGLGVAFINQLTVITSSVQALVISSSYTTLTSGFQHLDCYGVYHFDAQINGVHQFGGVFGWYTGSSIGSEEVTWVPVHSASANPIVYAQLFHTNNSLLELQVKLIGAPLTQSYDLIFSRLV